MLSWRSHCHCQGELPPFAAELSQQYLRQGSSCLSSCGDCRRGRALENRRECAGSRDPADNPDWMRWNNLGIALLDQFQYAGVHPGLYRGGQDCGQLMPTPIPTSALPRLSGRSTTRRAPPSARRFHSIPTAPARTTTMACCNGAPATRRKKLPTFARWLRCSRSRATRGASSASPTISRTKTKPRWSSSRHCRRSIPDDLAAHYNLSILYRRMGKREEAAEQQAMFVDKKVDPGAPTYSLNYPPRPSGDLHRKHPMAYAQRPVERGGGTDRMASNRPGIGDNCGDSGSLSLASCIVALPTGALAANNCAWINEATAWLVGW